MILGIDPGFSGAIAWYDEKGKRLVAVLPMPLKADRLLTQETRSEIDSGTLARLIKASLPLSLVVIEKVDASPQMGVVSAFRFGEGLGLLRGICSALELTPKMAYPSVWKSGMGLSKNKAESTALACKLFPEWGSTFLQSRSSADTAEAALLAYYGLRFLKTP